MVLCSSIYSSGEENSSGAPSSAFMEITDKQDLEGIFNTRHFFKYNFPESPKARIKRHRHHHDENGSRTSDSSYSKSEDGESSDSTTSSPTPLRPGFALRGLDNPTKSPTRGPEIEKEEPVKDIIIPVKEPVQEPEVVSQLEPNIIEVAISRPELSTLVTAVTKVGLAETLSDGESFTVFAPTDEAFGRQPEEFLQRYLSGDWDQHLEDLLLSHVAGNRIKSSDLTNEMTVDLINDDTLYVTLNPPKIDGKINITSLDIEGSNGIIHEIDGVRLPPSAVLNTIEFLDLMSNVPEVPYNFSIFLDYLSLVNLTEAIATASPITMFVPTNAAIEASKNDALKTYLGENLNALGKVLAYHATSGNKYFNQLVGVYPTYEGSTITIEPGSPDGLKILTAQGEVKIVDTALASNGVMHVIDSLLVPTEIIEAFDAS